MTIQRLEKSPRLSGAVIANGTVYLTGQVGKLEEDLAAQCRTALGSVDTLLAAAGTDKAKLLEVTVLLADMDDFDMMNAVWEVWVDADNPPARSTYEARLTKPGYRVEFIVKASL